MGNFREQISKYNQAKEAEMVASMPESYQTVCGHIKNLTLELDEARFEELRPKFQDNYIQEARTKYIKDWKHKFMNRDPEMSKDNAELKAIALWENYEEKRIKKLHKENYERMIFIEDKVLEMDGRDEMPIYGKCEQGRLHHYLTNMPRELYPFVRLNGCKIMSYDLKTSQPIFIWIALGEYIEKHNITLECVKKQADEILETIRFCGYGTVPVYIQESFDVLKQNLNPKLLEVEMTQLGKLFGKDFYDDVMQSLNWERKSDGTFNRDTFKSNVLFPFLYGTKPSWGKGNGYKKMIHYFVEKFPAIYTVLWRMRRFTEICLEYHRMTKDGIHFKEINKHIKKKFNTADFPKDMQARESRMFFEVIIPQIDIPCVTIHDSILVESGKKCNVAEIIGEAFLRLHQIKVRVESKIWSDKKN